jgi:hypothetical protein
MAVETSAQSLLVEVVGNETDAAAKNEETVEDTHLEVVFGFLRAECAAVADQVNKADSNTTINVEDKVIFLGGRHRFHSNSVVKEFVRSKVLHHKFLDKLNTEIGVVSGLDSVANTGDCRMR